MSVYSGRSPHVDPSKGTGQPKPTGIGTGSVVCAEAQLHGDITIGSCTVVHPTAKIIAEDGPIIIGNNNHIMEKVVITNKVSNVDDKGKTMIIGDNNLFEFHCQCQSFSIGSCNIFEAKNFIGEDVRIGDHCVIGCICSVIGNKSINDGSVITGCNNDTWIRSNPDKVNPDEDETYGRMLELWFLFCLIWSLGAGVAEEKMDNFILEMEGQFPSKRTDEHVPICQ